MQAGRQMYIFNADYFRMKTVWLTCAWSSSMPAVTIPSPASRYEGNTWKQISLDDSLDEVWSFSSPMVPGHQHLLLLVLLMLLLCHQCVTKQTLYCQVEETVATNPSDCLPVLSQRHIWLSLMFYYSMSENRTLQPNNSYKLSSHSNKVTVQAEYSVCEDNSLQMFQPVSNIAEKMNHI